MGIKCLVEECTYNKNQMCNAGDIQVSSSGDMRVNTSEGTCCHTFRPLK